MGTAEIIVTFAGILLSVLVVWYFFAKKSVN